MAGVSDRVMALAVRAYAAPQALRRRGEAFVERFARRIGGSSGQSEWVGTALKVGIGLAAAGLVYAFVAGPLKGVFTGAGSNVTNLNGGAAGGSLP